MDQKQFKITKLPREKLGNRAFSLWNEIELREKLKIIEEYLKLRNRLSLDISKILQR
jgi:hypothetical protein